MAHRKDSVSQAENHLLCTPTDTKMAKVLKEATELVGKFPEIIIRIKNDQVTHGKQEKLPRVLDKRWESEQTLPLLLEDILPQTDVDFTAADLELQVGCPRLKPEVIYLFIALRGCYGSVCSQSSWDRFSDSMTLRYYLEPYMDRLPGRITVLENLNAISNDTKSFIVDCQLQSILDSGLDDFRKQTIDSTSVQANSAWPTEVRLIRSFLNDAHTLGQRLDRFDLVNFHVWHVPRWLKQLGGLEFELNMFSSSKRHRQFRKSYRQFIEKAVQILNYLTVEYDRLDDWVMEYFGVVPF